MLPLVGWCNVLAAVGYSLLNHFHLVEFTPVIDEALKWVCPIVGGAALHQATPPAKE